MEKQLTTPERIKFWKDKKIIGIDPGSSSGGIVIYSVQAEKIIESAYVSSLTPMDMYKLLSEHKNNAVAYMEKVHGVIGQGAGAAFTFGKNYGHLQMALLVAKIPTTEVTPQLWQKDYQIGTRGNMSKTQWKNKLKALAQQLYPNVSVSAKLGDAILLMHYGRRREVGL